MIESVIIGAKRSPIGIKNGKMLGIRPDDLASQVVRGLLAVSYTHLTLPTKA